jgi:hypothetical protein
LRLRQIFAFASIPVQRGKFFLASLMQRKHGRAKTSDLVPNHPDIGGFLPRMADLCCKRNEKLPSARALVTYS